MRNVQVAEAKAKLSGLLAAVAAGETVAIMHPGRLVARRVPDTPSAGADVFRPPWAGRDEIDLDTPVDPPPTPVAVVEGGGRRYE